MKEKLNAFHIALLIYMVENNITLFNLPRLVAEDIGTNGWVGYIILAFAAVFNIFLYRAVYRLGDGKSLFQILEGSIPKFGVYPLYIALSLFWIVLASFIAKNFFLIFQMLSFQTTNPFYIFFLFCIMVYLLLIKDLYNIGKAATVFFVMTIWTLGLTVYHFQDWERVRFTMSLFQDATHGHSIHNWMEVYTTFIGYELCLFFFPYVNKKSKLFKGVFIGHGLIATAQLIVLFVASGFFSFQQLQSLLYPVIEMLDFIEMPFISRIENLVFVIFLFGALISTTMFCFASLSMLRHVFPKVKPKRIEFGIVLLILIAGYLPKTLIQSELLLRRVLFTEIGVAFLLPVLLILILQLQKLKGKLTKHEN